MDEPIDPVGTGDHSLGTPAPTTIEQGIATMAYNFGHDEVAWAENRRAEFRIVAGTDPRIHGTVN